MDKHDLVRLVDEPNGSVLITTLDLQENVAWCLTTRYRADGSREFVASLKVDLKRQRELRRPCV